MTPIRGQTTAVKSQDIADNRISCTLLCSLLLLWLGWKDLNYPFKSFISIHSAIKYTVCKICIHYNINKNVCQVLPDISNYNLEVSGIFLFLCYNFRGCIQVQAPKSYRRYSYEIYSTKRGRSRRFGIYA